jgi:hypothetical protein
MTFELLACVLADVTSLPADDAALHQNFQKPALRIFLDAFETGYRPAHGDHADASELVAAGAAEQLVVSLGVPLLR